MVKPEKTTTNLQQSLFWRAMSFLWHKAASEQQPPTIINGQAL